VLQRAEAGDVQLGDSARQNVHTVSLVHSKAARRTCESVGQCLELAVGVVPRLPVLAEPPDGQMIAKTARCVTIDGFVGNIQAESTRQTVQLLTSLFPGEACRACS
jgi:hypothetical protein